MTVGACTLPQRSTDTGRSQNILNAAHADRVLCCSSLPCHVLPHVIIVMERLHAQHVNRASPADYGSARVALPGSGAVPGMVPALQACALLNLLTALVLQLCLLQAEHICTLQLHKLCQSRWVLQVCHSCQAVDKYRLLCAELIHREPVR